MHIYYNWENERGLELNFIAVAATSSLLCALCRAVVGCWCWLVVVYIIGQTANEWGENWKYDLHSINQFFSGPVQRSVALDLKIHTKYSYNRRGRKLYPRPSFYHN